MFMSEAIDYIIHFTNMQGHRMVAKWNYNHPDERKTWNIVDQIEMETFIGLFMYTLKLIYILIRASRVSCFMGFYRSSSQTFKLNASKSCISLNP